MTRGVMYSHDVDAPGHASVIYKPIVQDGIKSDTVDTSNLIPKNVRSYYLAPHTYMVSYAQGNMAKAFLPGTLMPGTFVNQDWAGMKAHIAECARAYFRSKKKAKSINLEHKNYRAIWIIEEYYKIKDQKHKNQVNKK
jgi:hypothetical protein